MSTTRDGLLTAAAAAFDRDGYVRATIDDVCDRAGVTKGALYGHFSSKKALAVAVLDRQAREWAETRDRLQRANRGPLQVLVDLGYAVNQDRAVVQRLLFQAPISDDVAERQVGQWTATVRDLLRSAAFQGELRPGVDVDACADAVVAALVGVHLMSLAVEDPAGVARQLSGVWRTWLPTIARPEVYAALRVTPPRRRV
ncbi:TetR/AcrR family transcriptional regulator [Saccharothrix obliqua]|uniref:TetR/AcrR family transcriptional regulator n=1 Tax=Saccharothrix obliqua TaxID=2861747 RepID=UPI001C605D1E|nr:TetR/AcrR family transcriptional regulator [Saccharothrix obliqua]MBW4716916.1 TetR/AcrR family transcriptional regulator [Saccharothrix obliqua]